MQIMNKKLILSFIGCIGVILSAMESQTAEVISRSGLVNILELGAKNDGSEDISPIVNQYTATCALLLPAGIYRVEHPLVIKHPIIGEGYARNPTVDSSRTWLVSAIVCEDGGEGVVSFSGNQPINVENLSIVCNSHECGIRIAGCTQSTSTFISKVAIFNVRSYGLYIQGGGSRPIFAQDMTIFGSSDWPVPGVGIYNGPGVNDNRFSHIEIMGMRVGMEIHGAITYGNNLHIWTGCMPQKDNGTWWRGTRGIVLGDYGRFVGSEIYPDTCFYVFETTSPTTSFLIQNMIYWEDNSTGGSPDYDGELFHGVPGSTLAINGGQIGFGQRMAKVFTPDQKITDVMLFCDIPLTANNIDRLCTGMELPDYTVQYTGGGFGKVATIFTVSPTGACEGTLSLSDGAAFSLSFVKDASGAVHSEARPLNSLCTSHEVKFIQQDDMVSVYLRLDDATPVTARFTTSYMTDHFRPLDFKQIRDRANRERCREILQAL